MLTAEDLAQCRATHEETMMDIIELRRPGGIYGPLLPDGSRTFTRNEPYYLGKATCQALPVQSGRVLVADQQVTHLDYAVHVPVAVVTVEPEDVVDVISSMDPAVTADIRVTVKHVQSNTFATARRLVGTRYEEGNPP